MGRIPWNPPASKAPTWQAEEQKTATRFEPASGTSEAQKREPVSHLEAEHRPPRCGPKKAQGSGSPGVGPCHVGKRKKVVPSQLAVQEAFLTDDWNASSAPPCARDAGYVHILASGFPNFRLNAYIGLDKSRGRFTQVFFDTATELNLVREDFLPKGWERHRRSVKVQFVIMGANGRRIQSISSIALVIRMSKTQMPATFFVVEHLAVPVLLGCAFAHTNVLAILPMDDMMVLPSD